MVNDRTGGGAITRAKISYGIGSNVLLDNLDYGKNLLILHSSTQKHEQLYRRFLQQSSEGGGGLIYLCLQKTNIP